MISDLLVNRILAAIEKAYDRGYSDGAEDQRKGDAAAQPQLTECPTEPTCEGCGERSTTGDSEGVALCEKCYQAANEHDAEVRNPLVDALVQSHQILGALVRALDAGALSVNPSTLLTEIRVAFKKCDDALAKEGKC